MFLYGLQLLCIIDIYCSSLSSNVLRLSVYSVKRASPKMLRCLWEIGYIQFSSKTQTCFLVRQTDFRCINIPTLVLSKLGVDKQTIEAMINVKYP